MEENNLFYYYLQDEMGSPLRVSRKEGEKAYLTYGYDEFGNDLGKELEQAGIPNPYSRQGEGQPFGYTGYRHDSISDTYFAQAREYNPKTGRFTAEDVIKGNGLMPQTLNPYIYCLNNPLIFSDPSGLTSEKEAQEIIRDNAQYILEAADRFEIDSNLLAGCIYIEQVKNVNFKDEFDTILVWGMGFDSSIGVSQVKVSTAKMLQEKGYMPESTTSIFEILCCIRKNEKIAIELGENKINIQYAAAYIKYMKEEWAEVYPEIETDIGIQATLYNLGHEKLRKGFVGRILGILSEGFKDERSPHANPTENDFGNEVLGVYALMEELLNEGNCNN